MPSLAIWTDNKKEVSLIQKCMLKGLVRFDDDRMMMTAMANPGERLSSAIYYKCL